MQCTLLSIINLLFISKQPGVFAILIFHVEAVKQQ